MHYPQDVTTFSIDDQFLLGEKLGGQLVVGGKGRAEKLALVGDGSVGTQGGRSG